MQTLQLLKPDASLMMHTREEWETVSECYHPMWQKDENLY